MLGFQREHDVFGGNGTIYEVRWRCRRIRLFRRVQVQERSPLLRVRRTEVGIRIYGISLLLAWQHKLWRSDAGDYPAKELERS